MAGKRDQYLDTAAILVRCAAMVAQDSRQPEPVRRAREDAYGKRAVDLLRDADQRRLIRPEDLDFPEFAPLRSREDFRRLREKTESERATSAG